MRTSGRDDAQSVVPTNIGLSLMIALGDDRGERIDLMVERVKRGFEFVPGDLAPQ